MKGQGHIRRRKNRDGSPGSWQVIVDAGRDPDTGKRRTLSGSAATKREAVELRNRLLVQAGVAAGLERDAPAGAATVAELFEEWIGVAAVTPGTRSIYTSVFNRWLRPAIGHVRSRELRARDLNAVYRTMAAAGRAPSAIRKVHTVASAMCSYGVRHEWMADHPARKADPPKVRRTKVRATPVPDIAAMVAALEGTQLGLCVLASAALGTRRGDTLGLQWADLDFTTNEVTIQRRVAIVPGGIEIVDGTKNDTVRTIAVDPATMQRFAGRLIEAQATAAVAGFKLSPQAFIFARDVEGRAPWHPSTATHKVAALRRELGLTDAHLHGLRHHVATSLLAAGVDVRTVAERLGNSADVVLRTYSHFVPANDHAAAELLGRALAGVEPQD